MTMCKADSKRQFFSAICTDIWDLHCSFATIQITFYLKLPPNSLFSDSSDIAQLAGLVLSFNKLSENMQKYEINKGRIHTEGAVFLCMYSI